jgi:hypothetical protein
MNVDVWRYEFRREPSKPLPVCELFNWIPCSNRIQNGSSFSSAMSLSGANKSLVATGPGFWYFGGGFYLFLVQLSSSDLLSLFRRLFCSCCKAASCLASLLFGCKLSLISMYEYIEHTSAVCQQTAPDHSDTYRGFPLCFSSVGWLVSLCAITILFGRNLNKLSYLN